MAFDSEVILRGSIASDDPSWEKSALLKEQFILRHSLVGTTQ